MSAIPPLIGQATWTEVMDRAGYRCQCSGQCGRPHTKNEGRCPQSHGHYMGRRDGAHLIAAAKDYTPSVYDQVRTPVGDLMAWCASCHDGTRRAYQRKVAAMPDETPSLFEDIA
jgi:hypothetical protein